MANATCSPGGRWCEQADALFGVEGIHVCSVAAAGTGGVLNVEAAETVSGCPECGVARPRRVRLHDTPCFGRAVRLLWAKRVWRCPDPDCPRTTFTEEYELGPRAKLTARGPSSGRPTIFAAFRHLGLGPGPPARRLLVHRLGRHQGRGRPSDRDSRPADRRECSWRR